MVRRIPPGKVSYFEQVPLARNIVIESIFEVGRPFWRTMRIDCACSTPAR
jgi:hypothetical protein